MDGLLTNKNKTYISNTVCTTRFWNKNNVSKNLILEISNMKRYKLNSIMHLQSKNIRVKVCASF